MITDLTRGKPLRVIWNFSLPLLLSTALQQIYNVADSIIVGQFTGAEGLAAIAVKPCEVLTIDRTLYDLCCERFQDFREVILHEISKDLGTLFDELADASMMNAEIRVARFLCRRLANGQHQGTEEAPEFRYTQEFIANVLGISRMSVSQAIAGLSARGWLETSYGKIRVTDTPALRMYAYG